MTDHHDFGDHPFDDHPLDDHAHDGHGYEEPLPFEEPAMPDDHDQFGWDDGGHDLVHEPDSPPEPHVDVPHHEDVAPDPEPHPTLSDISDVPEESPFPPAVDVGDLPEPVDGFPWIDSGSLGLADIAAALHDTEPVHPSELAEYSATDLPPGVDPWAALADSDDPATAALARWWSQQN